MLITYEVYVYSPPVSPNIAPTTDTLSTLPGPRGATRQARFVVESVAGRRIRVRLAAVLAACLCSALWVGASADVASARECGRTKDYIDGKTARVQVVRGPVTCRRARAVISFWRYHVHTLSLVGEWSCTLSRSLTIITCRTGRRTVRGLRTSPAIPPEFRARP
jgi:hypothetical protein